MLWIAAVILLFAIYFAGLGPLYQDLNRVCGTEECPIFSIAAVEVQILENIGLSMELYVGFILGLETFLVILFSILAALIFWRKSDTWLGLLISLAFIFVALFFFAEESRALAKAFPRLQLLTDFLISISVVLMMLLFYVFPDGRFSPRWMKWFAATLFIVVVLDPFINKSGSQATSASLLVILSFAIGAPLGLFSQIYRFRKVSTPTQRQQTKWLLFGFVGMFGGMLPWMIFGELFPLSPGMPRLIFYLSLIPQYILVSLFPISVVVAIQRHRLWDIDLVIRRTLQYTILTGLLALVYFGGIVVLQSILRPITGASDSPLVIVITTLGIAALFNTLRSRVQEFIDRRFYRSKYDAQQTLAEFAETARDEVDMEALSGELLSVVHESMQPEYSSLWFNRKNR
jgi:hypothetical protein